MFQFTGGKLPGSLWTSTRLMLCGPLWFTMTKDRSVCKIFFSFFVPREVRIWHPIYNQWGQLQERWFGLNPSSSHWAKLPGLFSTMLSPALWPVPNQPGGHLCILQPVLILKLSRQWKPWILSLLIGETWVLEIRSVQELNGGEMEMLLKCYSPAEMNGVINMS